MNNVNLNLALNWLDKNQKEILNELETLVRFPSVSFPNFDEKPVLDCANATLELLKKCGLENTQLLAVEGAYPYVYADWLHAGAQAPTILLYAHYDVQPPLRAEKWLSPAFEPTIRDGRMYARGAADDKSGICIHYASLAAFLQTNQKLPVNIKVLIEGEEESGSEHLDEFLEIHGDLLSSDVMVLMDLANWDTGLPSLTTSLRGIVVVELEVKAMDHAIHSGMWGGPVPDPVQGLAKIIAGLTTSNGMIDIPELYDMILEPTEQEKKSFEALSMSQMILNEQLQLEAGVSGFVPENKILESLWRLPSLSVNAIEAGNRKTAGNVLLESSWARIGLRLAPGMDSEKSKDLFVEKIKSLVPWGLTLNVSVKDGTDPWNTSPDHPFFKVAQDSLEKGYGEKPCFMGCGGTIPFVAPLSEKLGGIPALLVGVEDPYCNAHGENESLDLGDFFKAIQSQIHFFQMMSDFVL
jgi:acetylornithine deacetylase/succinyl-diaminopimelate desuccinylase-like protein